MFYFISNYTLWNQTALDGTAHSPLRLSYLQISNNYNAVSFQLWLVIANHGYGMHTYKRASVTFFQSFYIQIHARVENSVHGVQTAGYSFPCVKEEHQILVYYPQKQFNQFQ